MSDVTDLKAAVLLLSKENAELRGENKALRELCRELLSEVMYHLCSNWYLCTHEGDPMQCTDTSCGNRIFLEQAQELGVMDDA